MQHCPDMTGMNQAVRLSLSRIGRVGALIPDCIDLHRNTTQPGAVSNPTIVSAMAGCRRFSTAAPQLQGLIA